MNARVKADHDQKSILALGGREYIKGEWRPIPAGSEDEAQRHPMLEIEQIEVEIVRPVKARKEAKNE